MGNDFTACVVFSFPSICNVWRSEMEWWKKSNWVSFLKKGAGIFVLSLNAVQLFLVGLVYVAHCYLTSGLINPSCTAPGTWLAYLNLCCLNHQCVFRNPSVLFQLSSTECWREIYTWPTKINVKREEAAMKTETLNWLKTWGPRREQGSQQLGRWHPYLPTKTARSRGWRQGRGENWT